MTTLDYNMAVIFLDDEEAALREVTDRLRDAGSLAEDLERGSSHGLLLVRAQGDAKGAVKKLRGLAYRFPEAFMRTLRWTPVEAWVPSDEASIVKAVGSISQRIGPEARWRIDIEGRHGGPEEGYENLSKHVTSGTEDVASPDVMIKIVRAGDLAGIALVTKEESLDVNHVRWERNLALLA